MTRGEDDCRPGQAESVDWGERHMTAEASGSEKELCLAELDLFEAGEAEGWTWNAYSMGDPVCNRTMAALRAIETELCVCAYVNKPQRVSSNSSNPSEDGGKESDGRKRGSALFIPGCKTAMGLEFEKQVLR